MVTFEEWGQVDYDDALERQLTLVDRVQRRRDEQHVVYCSHPPTVTLGRGSQPSDLQGWSGLTREISRGGRATYHGPQQVIIYPILALDQPAFRFPTRDLHAYLRFLEDVIARTLKDYGVSAEGRSRRQDAGDQWTDATGVWVGERKLASLGIGVKRWVSYHGAAVNLNHDPQAFQGLRPCGFSQQTMVSLEELMGRPVDREEFIEKLSGNFSSHIVT